jgi:hypothetical protein
LIIDLGLFIVVFGIRIRILDVAGRIDCFGLLGLFGLCGFGRLKLLRSALGFLSSITI